MLLYKMKINLNKYKFVVSTGCSYGVVHTSFLPNGGARASHKEFFDTNWNVTDRFHIKDNVVSISVSVSSQGAKWQSDSIIYTTKRLLDLGVKPENIYCFVEWSEWDRGTTTIPSTIIDTNDSLKKLRRKKFCQEQQLFLIDKDNEKVIWEGGHVDDKYPSNDLLNYLRENLDIGQLDCDQTIGYINSSLYVTASQIPWHIKNWNLKNEDEENPFDPIETMELETMLKVCIEEIAKKEKEYTVEELLTSYLNYIYLTQSFFKEHGIEYNFTHINNQLCGYHIMPTGNWMWERENTRLWDEDENGDVIIKDNPSKYIKEENDLENVATFFKWKMDLIDLSKFNYHNCKRWRRGGIDNYLLDKFGEGIYNRLYTTWEINSDIEDKNVHQLPSLTLGNHPNQVLYCFVWDRFAKDCKFLQFKKEYLEMVEEKYWEDFNCDTLSLHDITISKLYMNKWGLEKD